MFCLNHRSIKVTLFSEIHIKIISKISLTYHQIAFFLKLLRSMPKSILNTILSFWLHFTYVAIYKNVKRFW